MFVCPLSVQGQKLVSCAYEQKPCPGLIDDWGEPERVEGWSFVTLCAEGLACEIYEKPHCLQDVEGNGDFLL